MIFLLIVAFMLGAIFGAEVQWRWLHDEPEAGGPSRLASREEPTE